MPRWRYLTGSYVEALGLEHIPVRTRRNGGHCWLDPNDTLPAPGSTPYVDAVEFEGARYRRDLDGLSYELMA